MSSAIEIRKLRKEFGLFRAVDDVSFSVNTGEVLGFLGPNGAGKSTTMKMAAGFLDPTMGTAEICGYDILKKPMDAKRRLGYLPEGAPAYPDMTPLSFLRFVAEIRGYRGAEKQKRVDAAVAKTSLESHLHQPIETLSKGFKRRVGLAQAILHDPPVLIMDEPTDGLDPNQKHDVRRLIQEMAATKAIILSTHILEEVEAVCTRAVIIAAGRVIADGTPAQLQSRAANHHLVQLSVARAGAENARGKLEALDGVARVENVESSNGSASFAIYPRSGREILPQVGDCARNEKWQVREIHQETGRLDDVFRQLTVDATAKAGRES